MPIHGCHNYSMKQRQDISSRLRRFIHEKMGSLPKKGGSDIKPQEGFTIKDAPVENLRPFRVIVVGAGFSGILAAIRIPERLRNVELVVYEKNEGVGGVWYELCLARWSVSSC